MFWRRFACVTHNIFNLRLAYLLANVVVRKGYSRTTTTTLERKSMTLMIMMMKVTRICYYLFSFIIQCCWLLINYRIFFYLCLSLFEHSSSSWWWWGLVRSQMVVLSNSLRFSSYMRVYKIYDCVQIDSMFFSLIFSGEKMETKELKTIFGGDWWVCFIDFISTTCKHTPVFNLIVRLFH